MHEVGHRAAILHHAQAGGAQAGGEGLVADALLEPHRAGRRVHGEQVVEVAGEVLGASEDVDEVHGLPELGHSSQM